LTERRYFQKTICCRNNYRICLTERRYFQKTICCRSHYRICLTERRYFQKTICKLNPLQSIWWRRYFQKTICKLNPLQSIWWRWYFQKTICRLNPLQSIWWRRYFQKTVCNLAVTWYAGALVDFSAVKAGNLVFKFRLACCLYTLAELVIWSEQFYQLLAAAFWELLFSVINYVLSVGLVVHLFTKKL
jgi:hypothetical protein